MALQRLLTNPPGDYYPVPWWAWTGELKPELMRRQLRLMREQGIREFFIFPIYGMVPEFMSDAYLDRIGWTLEWCRELGTKVWIYDELNWPSGTAAGLVARRHPSAIASNIYIETYTDNLPDGLHHDPSVVHIYQPGPGEPTAVYRRVKDPTVNITVKGCLWTRNEPGMLDLLSKEAVAAFIEEAYEPIAKRFPDELGKTIVGFFTDEPSIAPGHIPWTDELPERFREAFGCDIVERLHELNFPAPDSELTRMRFWQIVSEMSSEAYTGQIAQWCEDHGLLLTGHMVWEEDSHSVWYQGDSPMHQIRMQVPGCDLLQTPTNFDDDAGWYNTGNASLAKIPKDPASAARWAGRKRVMCEAYGVMPWHKTMVDEKRLTDWLVALGVNLINDNSLISDISGFRKRAISGKHFTQPWWPHAHLYYDYAARICGISAQTTLETELLVLYPTTTWWCSVVRTQEASPEFRSLEVAFDNTVDALVKTHWDFEMLFEDVLSESRVDDGRLVTSAGDFRAIVAAGITRLRPEPAAKLEQFAASGGAVILVDSEILVMEPSGTRPIALPGAVSISSRSEGFASSLDAALAGSVTRPWRIEGEKADGVISAARVAEDGRRLLFVANMTSGDKDLRVCCREGFPLEAWDADSGARWTPAQSGGVCSLHLPEGQSVWLVQAAEAVAGSVAPAHFVSTSGGAPAVELEGPFVFNIDRQNIYKLAPRLLPDAEGAIEFGAAALESEDGWIRLEDDDAGIPLGSDSMKRYWLKAGFELAAQIRGLQIIGDSDDVEKVYLNGHDLGEGRPETVWDEENRAWDVGDAIRVGRNEVLMRVKASPYNSEKVAIFPRSIVEPVVVRGWFRVDPETGALTRMPDRLKLGDIRERGYPHFAGTCVYQADFTWPLAEAPALVVLDCGRDVAEVAVDGHGSSLGRRAWGKRAFRIDKLTPGKHRILIRTTNTLGAVLTRFYNAELARSIPPSGLLSAVKIYTLAKEDA